MQRKMLKWFPAPAVMLALVLAACSEHTGPSSEALVGPSEVSLSQGAGKAVGQMRLLTASGIESGYDAAFVTPGSGDRILQAGDYTLLIPEGALGKPTIFEMSVKTDGTVGVELTASQFQGGKKVDVGAKGFRKALTLTLSYAGADLESVDEASLVAVWVKDAETLQPVPSTVDVDRDVVEAKLSRFSDYALAYP